MERKGDVGSELGAILLELTGRVIPDRIRGLDATLVLESPDETWTMYFRGGRMTVGAGAPERADTIVRSDTATLAGIQTGAVSGMSAFLDGMVTVRGNLNLALRAESMFEPLIRRPITAPRDGFIVAGDHQVSVVEAGKGDPVILLHGLGATKVSFVPTMLALAPNCRVIAPDLLGHGDTAKPRIDYSPATFSRFVVDLMDSMQIDRAHLIGNSLGGRISLEVAMSHPDRVRSLSLLCPAVAFLKRRWLATVMKRMRPELAFIPQPLPHRAVVAGIRSLFVAPDRLRRSWYDAAADEFLRVYKDRHARYALFDALRHIVTDEPAGDRGFWTRLERVQAPSLFLWGDADPLVPAAFSTHVERVMPSATSEVLTACGHVPQFEYPAATHGKIRAFIAAA